MLITHILISR